MSQDNLALPIELLGSVERYAVYRCYSDQGQLLYIGETGDLGKRLGAHAKKLWFVQVRGITIEWYADELEALNAERRAIHVEHPKYNVQHRATGTLSDPRRHAPRWKSLPPGRAKAAAIMADRPGLTNAEVAVLAECDRRTVQRARNALAGKGTS